jgi:hypothetical protein
MTARPRGHTVIPRDPEELEATGAPARAEPPASTTVGLAHLTVADLERSLDYYRRTIRPGCSSARRRLRVARRGWA